MSIYRKPPLYPPIILTIVVSQVDFPMNHFWEPIPEPTPAASDAQGYQDLVHCRLVNYRMNVKLMA